MRIISALRQRVSRFELVAFTTGFALMAYELSAARILAPSIGSSIYVWTSVIGVIIAALSLGYAAGGMLADKRVRRTDIFWLLLLATGAIGLTFALNDMVLHWVGRTFEDPRMQGLMAATLLFSPTSFILGTISPYLARLRVLSLETTGTSVAFLSAANALGGILGTFSVGFVFFSYIGSRETLLFTMLLLVLSSLLFGSWKTLIKRLALPAFLLWMVMISTPRMLAQGYIAEVNTPTDLYQVYNTTYKDRPVRVLVSGPVGGQSAVYLDGKPGFVFPYAEKMAELVAQAPRKDRILMVGGGALTLPQYLAETYPRSQIDVLEIDPRLYDISKEYFNFRDQPNIRFTAQDGRAYLNVNQTQYDIILVDAYNNHFIPFALTTREFSARLNDSLRPGGLVIANLHAADTAACRPLLQAIHGSYHASFPHHEMFWMLGREYKTWQNLVVAYSEQPLPNPPQLQLTSGQGPVLTDNFAPVERLRLECQRSLPYVHR
jgi:predicted membrane-bound spermidine synthase